MTEKRPSDHQAALLRAAATPGRPFGGRITVEREPGGYWRVPARYSLDISETFSTLTVRACIARGWVEEYGWRYNSRGKFCVAVAVTPAGRAVLEVLPVAK